MDKQVHIWWANLRDFDSHVPELQSVLSVLEQARARRFQFLRDRNNYIISHGLLRMLLGHYAGKPPSRLRFRKGRYGKPELQDVTEERQIHFNISHSEDVALYGITPACRIGVDVEYVRTFPDYDRVAQEFFPRAECKSLEATSEELRAQRFLELWTRKEALLKATGEGLGDGLAGRVDSLSEPGVSGCTDLPQTFGASGDWQVRSFSPVEGYIAAVALGKANLNFISRGVPVFFSDETGRSGCYVPGNQDRI